MPDCRQPNRPTVRRRTDRTGRGLSAGASSVFVQFFAFYGFIFLTLQYLQIVRGDSPFVAALSMLPMAVTMMPSSRLAPKLAARLGSRQVCATGLVLIAGALAILARLDATSPTGCSRPGCSSSAPAWAPR